MKTIEVTEEDIQNGQRASHYKCPVALALKRAIPEAEHVVVLEETITIKTKEDYLNIEAPESVREFTLRYDLFFESSPFKFTLNL